MSCWESESVHWMGCVARVGDWDSIEWMVGLSAMMRDSDSRVVFCCCCCCSVMIDGWCHEEDVVRLVTVVCRCDVCDEGQSSVVGGSRSYLGVARSIQSRPISRFLATKELREVLVVCKQ